MKKIFLYIDSMQKGGAQRVMANLADHYAKKGTEVYLINDINPVPGILEYDINASVTRLFLDKANDLRGIKKNVNRIRALRRSVKSEKPDCIVSFVGPPNLRMLIATFGLRVKKVVSVRNDPYREYGIGIKRLISRIIFLLADGCVFQTDVAANYFLKRTRRKSKVIFNPVNSLFYAQIRRKEDIKKEIAVVGRLQPQKNNALAINAFAHIINKFPDYKLVFYGEGPLENDLKKQAQKLGISDSVYFNGLTNNVEEKLATSSVFLMTSDYEGMPNALMEAMAVGVPVVSTDCPCGGPRNLILNTTQGTLVPCQDEQAIIEALTDLLGNDDLRETIGNEAKKRAQDFKPDIILKKWDSYLDEV